MRCKHLNRTYSAGRSQKGAALILIVLFIGLVATVYILKLSNSAALQYEKNEKTMAALAEAKRALLAYAATQDLTCAGGTNCPRPGDLPCPDTDNDGSAQSSCGTANGITGQSDRIGRLPWKTLGAGDLRDGDGERLWYAVSSRYKNNFRYRPLNTDTTGTISMRDSTGVVINDANSTTGLVAVVFSPGSAITRQDGFVQEHGVVQENDPQNYLDTAYGEDNANFIDSTANGFVMGPIRNGDGREIVNDRLLVITREDMHTSMESRVLLESKRAMLEYFCGFGNANYETTSCILAGGNRFYPNPAEFSDATCLGSNAIPQSLLPSLPFFPPLFANCKSSILANHGRIPANIGTPVITPQWDSNSIFRGENNGNWFQLNAWRELIHYAVAPACKKITPGCSGSGLLTLNNALVAPDNDKKVILITSGAALSALGQQRVDNADKTSEFNYLEDQNLTPLDDTYSRLQPFNNIHNDRAMSIQ